MHRTQRVGWLRAAVMGANDGIVSTASLIMGVAAAESGRDAILLAGLAGLVAGATSMAAGEYVSVSSQADTEQADLARERQELAEDPEGELEELTQIYRDRGLDEDLARKVAVKMMDFDALRTHARDELGLSTTEPNARPVQAAIASAATFSVGAGMPLLMVVLSPERWIVWLVGLTALVFLALLGGVAAFVGGAGVGKAVLRVSFWGALAMVSTAGVGWVFGVAV
jgi:vacuolar iron transporter family protein